MDAVRRERLAAAISLLDELLRLDIPKDMPAKQQTKYAAMWQRDEREASRIKEYLPVVEIKNYAAGEFLVNEDHEVPRRFIVGIEVVTRGTAPAFTSRQVSKYAAPIGETQTVYTLAPAQLARINISCINGLKIDVRCSRHHVDILHEALAETWKHGTVEAPYLSLKKRALDLVVGTANQVECAYCWEERQHGRKHPEPRSKYCAYEIRR